MTAALIRSLVEQHEEFSAGRDRRLVVARFATRWFVLEGFTTAPLSTYAVHGPVLDENGISTHEEAVVDALARHHAAASRERCKAKLVEA